MSDTFIIDELSLTVCIRFIKQHIRRDMCFMQKTTTESSFNITKQYDKYYPFINELLPNVLCNIIIEYAQDIFNINVQLCVFHNGSYDPRMIYMIHVTNDELYIDCKFGVKIINSKITINIEYIPCIISQYISQVNVINCYMKRYHPNKKPLTTDKCNFKNHTKCNAYINNFIHHAQDRETFDIGILLIVTFINLF